MSTPSRSVFSLKQLNENLLTCLFEQDITADPTADHQETFLQGRVTVGVRPIPSYSRPGVLISVPMPHTDISVLMVVLSYNLGTGTYNCQVSGNHTDQLRVMTAAQVDSYACRIGTRLTVRTADLQSGARVLNKRGEYDDDAEFVSCKLALPEEDDLTSDTPQNTLWVSVQQARHQSERGRFMVWCGISSAASSTPHMFQVSVHALRSVPVGTDEDKDTYFHVPAEN